MGLASTLVNNSIPDVSGKIKHSIIVTKAATLREFFTTLNKNDRHGKRSRLSKMELRVTER